jgi:DNA invertase Pin-like site-specific DNA recombinase
MQERKRATKAILLARVSTKDQEDGYSIEAQKNRLQEYCTRKGLEFYKFLSSLKALRSATVINSNRR